MKGEQTRTELGWTLLLDIVMTRRGWLRYKFLSSIQIIRDSSQNVSWIAAI